MRAVGYIRAPRSEPADPRAGAEAQRVVIEAEVARRDWQLVSLYSDAGAAKSQRRRPGLEEALKQMDSGEAEALVVAGLDYLLSSTEGLMNLMERAARAGWAPIVLDSGGDARGGLTKAAGAVLASQTGWERWARGRRAKEALARKRQETGATLGRPVVLPAKVRRRIEQLRAKGLSFTAIARQLNAEGVPTAHGGRQWYPATVRKMALGA